MEHPVCRIMPASLVLQPNVANGPSTPSFMGLSQFRRFRADQHACIPSNHHRAEGFLSILGLFGQAGGRRVWSKSLESGSFSGLNPTSQRSSSAGSTDHPPPDLKQLSRTRTADQRLTHSTLDIVYSRTSFYSGSPSSRAGFPRIQTHGAEPASGPSQTASGR